MTTSLKQSQRQYSRLVLVMGAVALWGIGFEVQAGAIGSYDNFDCFNDTGQEAEGFEIDVEDVNQSDLTREFPSNFSQLWVIRYGLPTVTAYDWTAATPDAAHSYDAGHKGVLITWAATLQNGQWVASQGNALAQGAPGVSGNGTPYNPTPTATQGESCWWYGLGSTYPESGCEHFGISFAGGVVPGKITYHWKLPDPSNTVLVNGPLEATLPPSPVLVVAPPVAGAPPVVQAVARAPDDFGGNPAAPQDQEPKFGDAFWLETTTTYSPVDVDLAKLQIHNLKNAPRKVITWKLLQRPPGLGAAAGAPEREDAENDNVAGKNVQVTKIYQYFKFAGLYDSETHEAICDPFYHTAALAVSGGATVQVDCQNAAGSDAPYRATYYTIDPGTGSPVKSSRTGNLGTYLGAHINAYQVQ